MAARLSIPTSGTFVSPFVRLVLISPSQPRKTTAAFPRLHAPPFFLAPRRPISLALPSFPLSRSRSFHRSIFFSFSLSILRLAAASVSAPRRAAPHWRQHGPAASLSLVRALVPLRHSSCSFRTLSLAVHPPCIRLSSPPSSYNLLLSRGAAILPRPKRRHTYARSPSPDPIQQPPFSSRGILCRSAAQNSVPLYNVAVLLKNYGSIRGLEFAFVKNVKTLIYRCCEQGKKEGKID